jgi:tetratricopeptide (TPR) repeat protein
MVRSWRGERRFALAMVWCLAALLVTLVVPIPILLADRYWYFAMPMLLAVIVEAACKLSAPNPRHVQVALGGAVVCLCVVTLDYARVWRTSTALWTHALTRHPTDVEAWVSLGAARDEVGDYRGSGQAYHQALKLVPDYAEAAESLANVEMQTGQITAARQRLAAILEREPDRSSARSMFAIAFDLQGDVTRAGQEFARGLQADPNNTALLMNYVNFCERRRRRHDARQALEAFVERNPHSTPARDALFRLARVAEPSR